MLNKTIPVGVDGSSATITSYVFAPTEDAYALNRCLQLWSCQEAATITFRRAKASR